MKEVKIREVYVKEEDITFILKETFFRGEPLSTESCGFYYGKPDDEMTEEYIGVNTAEFFPDNTETFYTYPDVFSDADCTIENEEYDDTCKMFTVPQSWAVDWILNNIDYDSNGNHIDLSNFPVDELLNFFHENYEWDDTLDMYAQAKFEFALLREIVVERE